MAERYKVVVMQSNGWKISFNVALGIHIMILLGALYLPGLFKAKPKFADIYSVSLVNVADIETPAPAKAADPGPPKTAPKPKPPPPPKKKEIPVEEPKKLEPVKAPPIAETPPAPPKVVSLKPLKQKKVNVEKEPPPKKPDVDRKQLQKLAQALREEEILEEKARLAREALEQERRQLAETLRATETPAPSSPVPGRLTGSPAPGASSVTTLIEKQYYSEILNRLLQFWSVPEYLQKELEAIVFLTIDQDGQVVSWEIETSSGDRLYDQFVSKTIEAAKPFPPIPPAMRKERVDLGLRFKPGSIQ